MRLETPTMKKKTVLVLVIVLCVISIIFLITGIVLIVKSSSKTSCPSSDNTCLSSEEAKRISLDKFLQKVHDTYYEVYPEYLYSKSGVTSADIKKLYKPYDPSPEKIKQRTDTAKKLYKEISKREIKVDNLKQREKKALSQVKFFLKFVFGTPFDGNYYAGDWLMGPDLFCYKPICNIGSEIHYSLPHFKPSTVEELEAVRDKLLELNQTFARYVENLKLGVLSGMVGSVETCKGGLQALGGIFKNVFHDGEKGIFKEYFVQKILKPEFLEKMQGEIEQLMKWRQKYGKSVDDSLREFVLLYLGRPINTLLRFLATEYKSHCVPSSVSSGLSTLPLPFVYINGTADINRPTKRMLPTGEPLNGTWAYEQIMPYFTTNDMTPNEVYNIGMEMLKKLYPEALEIARQVTGESDNTTAKEKFIQKLNTSDMYFDTDPIPANETGEQAHKLCQSISTAKKYCPTRWKAMHNWLAEARKVMSMLDAETTNMFYFTGEKRTTPNCPVKILPDFSPASSAQSYLRSGSACNSPSSYYIPFFLERPGPKYEEWSVNAHEARPGHHTQDQGSVENFLDSCGGLIGWIQETTQDSYNAFAEGWAMYAESPLIARETDLYKDNLLQKYGMLKWQIWRALRLIVDTGLHYKKMTRQEALQKFADYAWTTGDSARKEVTRYQSVPGQATAYMIGQRFILKLREYAKKELGSKFNLKDFHYQILSQGVAPLSYLGDHIRKYVSCAKDASGKGCKYVLKPRPRKTPTVTGGQVMERAMKRDSLNVRMVNKPPLRRYL